MYKVYSVKASGHELLFIELRGAYLTVTILLKIVKVMLKRYKIRIQASD